MIGSGSPFHDLARDIRYALRQLRRSPAFTIVAALTFAMAIGATTAILAQLNAVLFKDVPARNPEELRRLAWNSPRRGFTSNYADVQPGENVQPFEFFSYAAFQAIRDGNR